MARMDLPEETPRWHIWMYKVVGCEERRMHRIAGASIVLICSHHIMEPVLNISGSCDVSSKHSVSHHGASAPIWSPAYTCSLCSGLAHQISNPEPPTGWSAQAGDPEASAVNTLLSGIINHRKVPFSIIKLWFMGVQQTMQPLMERLLLTVEVVCEVQRRCTRQACSLWSLEFNRGKQDVFSQLLCRLMSH